MRGTLTYVWCAIFAIALLGSACVVADERPADLLPPPAGKGDHPGADDGGEPDDDDEDDASGSGSGDEGGGDSGDDAGDLPCEIEELFAEHCRGCHSDPPKYGAPMPLTHVDDVLLPLPSDPTRAVSDALVERIEDAANPMPPTGLMPEADRDVIQQWLAAGAPPGSGEDCGSTEPPDEPVGPEALPCEPSHTFVAHGETADDPFAVPDSDDLYMCFTFRSPWSSSHRGTAWAPVVDDERVLHHWILYRTSEAQVDGGAGPCNMPGDATFLAGWAPGGTNYVMPDDVGLELAGEDEWLILQIHYNNVAGYQDALDRSGVAMCTVDTPRENTAGIIWLGTFAINIPAGAQDHDVTGLCPSVVTSLLPQPLNILSSFPHMHELGRAFKTDIVRGGEGGTLETLVDVPNFNFANQVSYNHDPPVVLNPGDALVTTCTYDNDTAHAVEFGEGTSDEMCFNFILTYPIEGVPDFRQCTL